MGFEICSNCSNLILDKQKSNLCPDCEKIESINIQKITDYFKTFENVPTKTFSVSELSAETGIEIQEIERLYRTNKLRSYTSLIDMNCKLCGNKFKPTIFSGAFCKQCTNKVEKVATELKESDKAFEKPESPYQKGIYKKDDENKGFRFK